MKVTYNWLKEFVDFKYSPQELADHLTMLGLQVELVVPVKLLFSRVVVGKILEIAPHPNSKKLLLCKVTTGDETLQIVCGANNISKDDLVPTAIIGAVLADNTQIIKRTIAGVDSYGMLCSEEELGLYDTSHGILILSKENTNGKVPAIGKPLENVLDLNDTILDINVTPNRPDALSIIGIAREISALTGNPIKLPKIHIEAKGPATKELVSITLKSPKLCPRYTARVIKNIQIRHSPFWIKYRLGLVGQRSINNIVDITNYVLIELGQPLHAFDYNVLNDKKIIVRTAEKGEQIVTIDNEPKTLDEGMLVIADSKRPIAIAGIMGGKETEVGDGTKDILLESAYFEPTSIRRTSKKIGISTEASYRFERSIDPQLPPLASDRAVQLMQSVLGIPDTSISKGLVDVKKNLPKIPLIKITPDYCKRILGINIPVQKIISILKSIGCKVAKSEASINVKPPAWRQDIQKNIDLIEEIARLYGYTKIPSALPEAMVNPPQKQKTHELARQLRGLLTGMGLTEIISYSFIDPKDLSTLRMPADKYMKLANPLDKNTCIMRTTLLTGIINNIVYNFNRGNDSVHIFELGKCFHLIENELFPKEEVSLAIGIAGNPKELHWRKSESTIDFFYLKGILEELLKKLFIENYEFSKIENQTFCPGKGCKITIQGKQAGIFGELHPHIIKNLDIKNVSQGIYIAELNITYLLEILQSLPAKKFQQLPKFPSTRRDISIILDKSTESCDIIKLVREMNSDIIEDVKLFDVYEGNPVPLGKKSVTYAVIYRNKEKTLTDEEVDNIHNILRSKILENIKCEVRE